MFTLYRADILEGCSKSLEKARKELSSEISQLRERGDNSVLKLVEALNAKCFKGDVARALKEKVRRTTRTRNTVYIMV